MAETEAGGPAAAVEIAGFYDLVADDYHLAVQQEDWRHTVESQGRSLAAILRTRLAASPPWRVLDCSCGIGTQAIGLALAGHRVVGTDLSPQAVARARSEAASFGVRMTFAVADMRHLDTEVSGEFDAVVTCDNSVAHLTPSELAPAFRAIKTRLAPHGLLLVSVRDYDLLAPERPRVPSPPRVHDTPAGKRIVFQVWDWEPDGSAYRMTWLFVSEGPGGYQTSHVTTLLHAHQRASLAGACVAAGFAGPQWHLPGGEPGFHQPVLTARR